MKCLVLQTCRSKDTLFYIQPMFQKTWLERGVNFRSTEDFKQALLRALKSPSLFDKTCIISKNTVALKNLNLPEQLQKILLIWLNDSCVHIFPKVMCLHHTKLSKKIEKWSCYDLMFASCDKSHMSELFSSKAELHRSKVFKVGAAWL